MSERLDQLRSMLASSEGKPGLEQRITAIEAEIARLEAEEANTDDVSEEGSDT